MSDEPRRPFDPAAHLSKVSGADYLEVKWRLVWLRDVHPNADITTELRQHNDDMAIFSAHIAIPNAGSATGWGSESAGDFRDYIEKAETKALGRALAALGFGTQFTSDFADAESGRIADAPVNRSRQSRDTELSWHDFWNWARAEGISSKQFVVDLLGDGVKEMPPAAIKAALVAHFADMTSQPLPDELNPSDEELAATSGAPS